MDAISGCQKILSFDRISLCNTCSGSKCRPGTSVTQCGTCGGSGRVYYKQGFMSIAMACNGCNGEGTSIKNPCTSCYGKGVTSQKVKETINIPKGVDENMNLRLQRKVNFLNKNLNKLFFLNFISI
jgi:molecular chaperone DnaJ